MTFIYHRARWASDSTMSSLWIDPRNIVYLRHGRQSNGPSDYNAFIYSWRSIFHFFYFMGLLDYSYGWIHHWLLAYWTRACLHLVIPWFLGPDIGATGGPCVCIYIKGWPKVPMYLEILLKGWKFPQTPHLQDWTTAPTTCIPTRSSAWTVQ